MPRKGLGWTAAALPWLCPNTDSLIGLAETPADLHRLAGSDPALLALILRADPGAFTTGSSPATLLSPSLVAAAADGLARVPGAWLNPACTVVAKYLEFANIAGTLAERIAERTGRVDPLRAAVVARLSGLGWLAVAAVEVEAAALAHAKCARTEDRSRILIQLWGLDHDAIARRLATRWRLPAWAGACLGSMGLPFHSARRVMADPELFAVVQLAVATVETRGQTFWLSAGSDRRELLHHLGLDDSTVIKMMPEAPATLPKSSLDQNPHNIPLIINLLRATAQARSRAGSALVVRLEERIDDLTRGMSALSNGLGTHVRDAKLEAVAELAAGAGHEINNPLAVIATNAQRLLRNEQDPEREQTLRTIVRQTHRIAGILRELMVFARPPQPEPATVSAREIVEAVRIDLVGLASDRGINLEIANASDIFLRADPKQLGTAVAAVVRNGIEGTGADGWVRLRVEQDEPAQLVRFVVEDSGPGLSEEVVNHAFDPFYCGRTAGRGRGLGLSAAWRLVRLNGGDIHYSPTPASPTRFLIHIPRATEATMPSRRSA